MLMRYSTVIILGYKRSGTSLLRAILNSHPDIAIGPETKFMERVIKSFPTNFEAFLKVTEREAGDFDFSEETLKKIFYQSKTPQALLKNWCTEYKNNHHKKIWGDKTPQNFKYLKLLSKSFPNALYIHIVRHPYDVIGSAIKRKKYNGIRTILAWVISNYKTRLVRSKNYIFIRYEDFIASPKNYIDKILKELDVEQVDLLSLYESHNHGRIAEGDLWNKPIFNKAIKNDALLRPIDRFYINILCSYYMKKYDYD